MAAVYQGFHCSTWTQKRVNVREACTAKMNLHGHSGQRQAQLASNTRTHGTEPCEDRPKLVFFSTPELEQCFYKWPRGMGRIL